MVGGGGERERESERERGGERAHNKWCLIVLLRVLIMFYHILFHLETRQGAKQMNYV